VAAPVFQKVASKALLYRNIQAQAPEPGGDACGGFEPASVERPARLAVAENADEAVWTMPELRRLTVRSALKAMEGYPVFVQLNGSGIIAEQNPLPGSPLESGQSVWLRAGPNRSDRLG